MGYIELHDIHPYKMSYYTYQRANGDVASPELLHSVSNALFATQREIRDKTELENILMWTEKI